MTLTFGSLFAGIGGFDLGLERAGMVCKWQVEIDPFCRNVLEKHWPGVPKYGDIREINGSELEPVDLICGGFPCQDISFAGPRTGLEGHRSSLWFQMFEVLCMVHPKFVVVENVPGILSLGIGTVLGDLARLGYDSEWQSISASSFGAEHQRRRIFITSYLVREGLPLRIDQGKNGEDEGYIFTRSGFAKRTEIQGLGKSGASRWSGDVHGIPNRMDRIKSLGNAVVPQVAEWIGRRIMESLCK